MNLEAIIADLRANGSPIIGIQIRDITDTSTWKFNGRHITSAHRLDAIVAIDAALEADRIVNAGEPATSSARFWPDPPSQVELDVADIKHKLGLD